MEKTLTSIETELRTGGTKAACTGTCETCGSEMEIFASKYGGYYLSHTGGKCEVAFESGHWEAERGVAPIRCFLQNTKDGSLTLYTDNAA